MICILSCYPVKYLIFRKFLKSLRNVLLTHYFLSPCSDTSQLLNSEVRAYKENDDCSSSYVWTSWKGYTSYGALWEDEISPLLKVTALSTSSG